MAPILSRFPFEKRPKLLSITPSDIRLIDIDQSAPFSHLSASAQLNGSENIEWDRTRFRDSSQATKELAPKRRHETKQLYAAVDQTDDAHNEGREYKLPVFAFYGTNRAVNVPHNRMQRNEMLYAFNQGDKFVLAIVLVNEDDSHEGPYYIRRPFDREPDWGVSSINYHLRDLLFGANR